jgi:hypothetical protein
MFAAFEVLSRLLTGGESQVGGQEARTKSLPSMRELEPSELLQVVGGDHGVTSPTDVP